MALLTLIRHGQASFLEPNYDKLSERGERQSRNLGEYWVRTGARFDQVYHGPACRHRETGDMVGGVYRQAGLEWPEVVTLAMLDEYPGIQVMRTFLPQVMEAHEDVRALEAEFRQAGERAAAVRTYDKMFQRITRMWVDEQLDAPEVESWKSFCGRVARAILEIRERSGKNERIAVFTSGGVIAATARLALDLAPQRTLELSWTSRNASYAEFLSSGDRFSLSSFNNHPHLLDEELLTYR
jgi:broad specificity phosphatase PhoE